MWFIHNMRVRLRAQHDVVLTPDFTEADARLRRERYEVAVIDLNLQSSLLANNLDGFHVLEAANERNTPCVVVSQFVAHPEVREALRAYPWVAFPVDRINMDGDRLLGLVEDARRFRPQTRTPFGVAQRPFRLELKRKLEEDLWGQPSDEGSRAARHLEKIAKYLAQARGHGIDAQDGRRAGALLGAIVNDLQRGREIEPAVADWRGWLREHPDYKATIRDLISLIADGLTIGGVSLVEVLELG
jgi:hypothetical protein